MRRIFTRTTLNALALTAVLAVICGCANAVSGNAVAPATDAAASSDLLTRDLPPTDPATTGSTMSTTEPSSESRSSSSPSAESRESAPPAAASPSSTDPSSTVPSSTDPSSTVKKIWKLPDLVPDRPTNKFGDIAAEPGQSYGIGFTVKDKPAGDLVFVVSKLTVDPECQPGAPKPHRGHFLKIDLKVEPRALTDEALDRWAGSFRPGSWIAFDSKGTAQPGTDTDQAEECLDPDATLPYVDAKRLGQGKLITGSVVLDVSSPKGTVLLDLNVKGGWEYHYG